MAVVVWIGTALVGDLLLIPLLERVRGLSYLRLSAEALQPERLNSEYRLTASA